MTESQIQRAIIDYLTMQENRGMPLYFFRSGSGAVSTNQGRFFKSGRPGCPDITMVYSGRFYGLEVKTTRGRLSPAQIEAKERIENAGGLYFVVRCIDDVKVLFPDGVR